MLFKPFLDNDDGKSTGAGSRGGDKSAVEHALRRVFFVAHEHDPSDALLLLSNGGGGGGRRRRSALAAAAEAVNEIAASLDS